MTMHPIPGGSVRRQYLVADDVADVALIFAPTRTTILDGRLVEPPGLVAMGRVVAGATVQITPVAPALIPAGVIDVELQFLREAPVEPIIAIRRRGETPWQEQELEALTEESVCSEYSERQKLALSDAEQRCLFELDRQTNEALLACNPDVTPGERNNRRTMIRDVTKRLQYRLTDRWNEATIGSVDALTTQITELSQIFRDAMLALGVGADWAKVGTTLENFAAGELRETVTVMISGGFSEPRVVSEPDSYFVFLFAEFALAALDVGVDTGMWQDLLPSLVRMQRCYVLRFTPKEPCVTCYTEKATTKLDGAKRAAIDATFTTKWSTSTKDRAALEVMILENLKEAGSAF